MWNGWMEGEPRDSAGVANRSASFRGSGPAPDFRGRDGRWGSDSPDESRFSFFNSSSTSWVTWFTGWGDFRNHRWLQIGLAWFCCGLIATSATAEAWAVGSAPEPQNRTSIQNSETAAAPSSQSGVLPATSADNTSATTQGSTASADSGLNFLSLLVRGGWFMVPLTLLSLAVAALCLERAWALRRDRLLPERLVRQLGKLGNLPGGLDPRSAYQLCQNHPSAASAIFRSVLSKVGRPHAELEATLQEAAQRQAIGLQQTVSWLSLAAAIAPLIGLLGTVWGITQSFYDTTQLTVGQNRAEALSEGIYTALITTIAGLVIAIPATIGAHFFESRIVTVVNSIQEMILSVLPQLERYEGQVRFSTAAEESLARDSRDAREEFAAESAELPIPPPRGSGRPRSSSRAR